MKRPVQSMFQLWIALSLGVVLAAGCSDDDKIAAPPEEGPYLSNTSPSSLLENLSRAYKMKDIDGYTELFDTHQFTFVFDATDVEDDPDLDPSWSWPEEFTSTRNMFASALVLDVNVSYVQGDPVPAQESDGVSLKWMKVVVTNVELEIDTTDPLGGENIIYKVSGDRGTFFFEVYPDELVGGQPRQRIVEWRDERVGFRLPVETISWGVIKTVYN